MVLFALNRLRLDAWFLVININIMSPLAWRIEVRLPLNTLAFRRASVPLLCM